MPGIGKTTSIHCLAHQLLGDAYKEGVLELNASDERWVTEHSPGIRIWIQDVTVVSMSFETKLKLSRRRKSHYLPVAIRLSFSMRLTGKCTFVSCGHGTNTLQAWQLEHNKLSVEQWRSTQIRHDSHWRVTCRTKSLNPSSRVVPSFDTQNWETKIFSNGYLRFVRTKKYVPRLLLSILLLTILV